MPRATMKALFLMLLSAGPGMAEELVYFENGRALRVDKTRREGRWIYLTLAGEAEMGVLLRQVKKVEPAEPLPTSSREASVLANVVSGAGGGHVVPVPVAETFDPTEMGEEPVVAQPSPEQLQQPIQPQLPQGQDLVPRPRRGGRTTRR